MDPSEIARLVEELKLGTEKEETVIDLQNQTSQGSGKREGHKLDKFVVGKIFATRIVNRETLRTHVPRILQTRHEVDIEIVGDNIFVVVFTNDRDRNHALYNGPWTFFDSLMLLKAPKGLEKPTDVEFKDFTTWIQCHNLPIACMNPSTVRRIGEAVGKVEEIDTGEGGNCLGQYARIRVTRDIEKPLQRCVRITSGEDKELQTILIRYERLPEFCAACGRVGHTVRHCQDTSADKNKRAFGPWLKATRTMETRRRKEGRPGKESTEHNQLVRLKEPTVGEYTIGEVSSGSTQPQARKDNIVNGMDIDKLKANPAREVNEIGAKDDELARVIMMNEGEVTGGGGGQKRNTDGGDGKGRETLRLGDVSTGKNPSKNKGLKRRARENNEGGQQKSSWSENCGTKRKESETIWPDQQQPWKLMKSTMETEQENNIMAATAGQPRREP